MTIEDRFDHRIVNVVRDIIGDDNQTWIQTGDELEAYLSERQRQVGAALLEEINVYMGFDDLMQELEKYKTKSAARLPTAIRFQIDCNIFQFHPSNICTPKLPNIIGANP